MKIGFSCLIASILTEPFLEFFVEKSPPSVKKICKLLILICCHCNWKAELSFYSCSLRWAIVAHGPSCVPFHEQLHLSLKLEWRCINNFILTKKLKLDLTISVDVAIFGVKWRSNDINKSAMLGPPCALGQVYDNILALISHTEIHVGYARIKNFVGLVCVHVAIFYIGTCVFLIYCVVHSTTTMHIFYKLPRIQIVIHCLINLYMFCYIIIMSPKLCPANRRGGGTYCISCWSRWHPHRHSFLSALYLLNQWVDFDQTCIDTLLGWGKEVFRFWWPWPPFQGRTITECQILTKKSLTASYLVNQIMDWDS